MGEAIPLWSLLPIKDVQRLTTLSESEIYKRVAAGTFPRGRKLSAQKVAWLADDVFNWIAGLPWADARATRTEAA